MMRLSLKRSLAVAGALLLAGLVVGVPLAYRSHTSTKYRNFRVVEPDVLYRSGQMSAAGLASTVEQYGIKTVISLRELRDDGKPSPDSDEVTYCHEHGIRHVILSPAKWVSVDGKPAPVEPNVAAFLKILDDPATKPVLVHCFAGIHRTGGYVSLYRMEYDGWTAKDAIDEMKSMGTIRTTFDDEIPDYLRAYVRRADRGK